MRKILKSLPRGLDATYERMLSNIDEMYYAEVHGVLQWLAYAHKRLSLEAIAEVAAIDLDQRPRFSPSYRLRDPSDLFRMCGSLLTTITEGRGEHVQSYVTLGHLSVKEFLTSTRILVSRVKSFAFHEESAYDYMAKSCMSYLLTFDTFRFRQNDGPPGYGYEYDRLSEDYPLVRHAAKYWRTYAMKVPENMAIDLYGLILEFLLSNDRACFQEWVVWLPEAWQEWFSETGYSSDPRTGGWNMGFSRTHQTPLCQMIKSGFTSLAFKLLEMNEDPNEKSKNEAGSSEPPIWYAIDAANYEVAQALLQPDEKAHSQINKSSLDDRCLLNLWSRSLQLDTKAASANSLNESKRFSELLARHLHFPQKRGTPLHLAAEKGYLDAAKQLHAKGASLKAQTEDGHTPLLLASQNGRHEVISWLLELNVDANCASNDGWTPLHWAAKVGNLKIAKQLYAKGASLEAQTEDGRTPLLLASQNGRHEVISWLLELNVDANCASNDGWTPLHWAAKKNHLEIAKQLHAKDASLEAQTEDNYTPLYFAALYQYSQFVSWLLELNVDANRATNDGWTPLHLAAEVGNLKIAKQLYAKGASLEAQTEDGYTPLHFAARNQYSQFVSWLLELNVDANRATNDGWTPLHLATEKGNLNIAKQLSASIRL
jgi:ankyrin repeat protein